MNVSVCKLGFGTWQLGGENIINGHHRGWGDIDENAAIQAIHGAIDRGIQFFDTADAYGWGRSEEILGKAIKPYTRDKLVICTKFGHRQGPQGNTFQDFSPEWLEEAVVNSLKRLKTDYVDILLFHSPPDQFNWGEYDTTVLDQLIKKGYIRSYGISSKTIQGSLHVLKFSFGSVLEAIFNILDRRAEDLLLNQLDKQYRFIARVPLASGFLSPKWLDQEPEFKLNDWRRYLSDTDRQWFLSSLRSLEFLNEQPGGVAVSALRYLLYHPRVEVVIPGMRNIDHVITNHLALELGPLDPTLVEKIYHAVPDVPAHW